MRIFTVTYKSSLNNLFTCYNILFIFLENINLDVSDVLGHAYVNTVLLTMEQYEITTTLRGRCSLE